MSLSSKNTKNVKIQDQKESSETLASWNFKPQVCDLNFGKSQVGKVLNFKPYVGNLNFG